MKIDNLLIASAASATVAALAAGTTPVVTAASVASLALLSIRNSLNNPATSFSQTALTAFFTLSNFGTAEAMVNGRLPANSDANIAVPELTCGASALCTGFRLNQHQIMTAKHCVRKLETGKDRNCTVASDAGTPIFPSKIERHPDLDIALLTFEDPLPGKNVCVPPWMKPAHYKLSTRGQEVGNSTCGGAGSIIIAGRGRKEISYNTCNQSSKELSAGRFRRTNINTESRIGKQTQYFKGTFEEPQSTANSGDSGGLVLMCNTQTSRFETAGVHSLGYKKGYHDDEVSFNNKKSGFAAVSQKEASLQWVKSKMQRCNGEVLRGEDFISDKLAPRPKPASISTCVSAWASKKHGKVSAKLSKSHSKIRLIVSNNCKCAIELEVGKTQKIKRIIPPKREAEFSLAKAKRGIKAKYAHLSEGNEHQSEEINFNLGFGAHNTAQ